MTAWPSSCRQRAHRPERLQRALEVHAPRAEEARAALAPFAELVKSPEHVHTYRLTPLSIWNARAAGLCRRPDGGSAAEHARYPVPASVEQEVVELAARYGRVVITRDGDALRCTCRDQATAERLARDREAGPYLATGRRDELPRRLQRQRGVLKQALVAAGFPAEDLAGYVSGDGLTVAFPGAHGRLGHAVRGARLPAAGGRVVLSWPGSERGGSGVIVLPCGAGKTIVGTRRHGDGRSDDARAHYQPDLGQAVAARAPRQDHARGRTRSPSTRASRRAPAR